MSSDHKPNKPEERRRVQALGGRVVYSFGIPRGACDERLVLAVNPEVSQTPAAAVNTAVADRCR